MTQQPDASTQPRHHVTRLVGKCLLWMMVLGLPMAGSRADRPSVRVRFELAAPVFSGMTDVGLVTAHIANRIQGVGAREWPFVDWTTNSDPALVAKGEWLVRLEEAPISMTLADGEVVTDSIVRLKHFTSLPGQSPAEVPPPPLTVILYDAGQPKPGQNAGRLQRDLDAQLEKQLTVDFLERIEEALLAAIPIADKVHSEEPPKERIVIPLRRTDLQASPQSVFHVKFSNEQDGQVTEGDLEIQASRVVGAGDELSGCIFGQITSFVRHPMTVETPFWWNRQVHDLLVNAKYQVFIGEYKRDFAGGATTSGGEFVTPPN